MNNKCLTDLAEGQQIAASRRAGTLAVHSLDHFTLDVPDLKQAAQFYRAFGLEVREEGAALGLYTAGNPQRWAVLRPAARKRLSGLCFRAYPEDVADLRARAAAKGWQLDSSSADSFSLRDPDGTLVEVRAGGRLMPDAKAPFTTNSGPAGVQAAWTRSTAPVLPPLRLSHIAIFSTDVDRSIEFYCGVLGLAVADRSGSILAFLHGAHGSDHHILALAKSEGPGMHHCSWDMGSLDAIELSAARMSAAGYSTGWGLGRHVLGSNYFHYIQDPWGSYCEYTADIDYIPADCTWGGGDHPAEDAMFLWGPPPPADFIANREIA
jgi:catechol 2,3-dioxygenase